MAKDVFISYAREDQKIATEICAALEDRQTSVWMAPKSIAPGANFEESILQGITGARVFLLVLSKAANKSSFVANELNHAFTAEKTIITYRTADIVPDGPLKFYTSRTQWVAGYEGSFDGNMESVAEAIRALPRSENGASAGLAMQAGFDADAPAMPVPVRRASTLAKLRSAVRRLQRNTRLWMGVAGALGLGMVIFSSLYFTRATNEAPETRLQVNTPATDNPLSFAVSPDGRRLVYSATNQGKSQLWVRPLDSFAAQPLAGTEGASYPFWSPDSASIGFFADNKLKRADIVGGAVQALASASTGRGGAWNRGGMIVFASAAIGPLFKVPATGGEPAAVTRLETGQGSHRWPQFLPDGRHFVYFATGQSAGVYLGSLDGTRPERLTNADAAADVSPAGFLLFPQQGTLFAQGFDFKKLKLSGDPFPVAEQVTFDGETEAAGFSASSGILAYRTVATGGDRQLTWLDRSGKPDGAVGAPDTAGLLDVSLSPDGKRVAVERTVNGNPDMWLIDAASGVPTRFTFDPAVDQFPLWSPDGSRIVFGSNRTGSFNLYWKLSNGAGAGELLLASDQNKVPNDWSADARFLLFRSTDPRRGNDLWILPMFGDKKPFPFLKTSFSEEAGQFSPDGKWIAYESNESGQYEVYVQPFPGPGAEYQISSNGGAQPRWNRNSKEIFYVSLDSKMMAAPVKLSPDGRSLEHGSPAALFPVRIVEGPVSTLRPNRQEYAVFADGQRFLVNLALETGTAPPINVISNWNPKAAQ